MKKFFSILVAGLLIAAPMSMNAESAYQKQLQKRIKKEYKQKVKTLTKDGWSVFGSSHSIDVALLTHYDKLTGENAEELAGFAVSTQKNIGSAKLLQDAIEKYASMQGTNIKGRTVTEHGSELSEEDIIEIDHFLQGFDAKVQTAIKGEVKPSFMIYRPSKTANGKPCYEFEGYFIVNTAAAHKARMEAMQAMMNEQVAMRKLSDKTAKWIQEAFDAEEAQYIEE